MELGVGLTIEAILDLSELKSTMKIQLRIEVYWVDPRITYINLHKNKLNVMTITQKEELWTPTLIVHSTNDKTEITFDDELSQGRIDLNKGFIEETAGLDVVQNYKKYAGSEGYSIYIIIIIYNPKQHIIM